MVLRFVLLLALAASLVAGPTHAHAQRDPLAEPLLVSVGDGRSINDGIVTALAQDPAGLIWVGTTVGLVRYDGYQLRPVPVGGAESALRGASFVRCLLATPDGMLWVGLEGEGLARLDTATQRWTLYRPDARRPTAPGGRTVRALALDADGVLWVGTTGGGLYSLAPGAEDFVSYRRGGSGLPDDRVQSLSIDAAGTLWVGTWNGLARRARGGSVFTPVLAQGPDSLAGRTVSMLGQAPDGRLWVGTRRGELLRLDTATEQAEWLDRGDGASSGGGAVSMAAAGAGEVWVGREGGIDLRSIDGHLVRRLERDLRKPFSVGGNNVVALLRDSAGSLWVGSYGGGLQRHAASPGLWVRRGEGPAGAVFEEGDVRSLLQLRSGEIWAGTHDRGVAVFDTRLRLVAEIRPHGDGARAYEGGHVGAMAQTADGRVWVGSDGGVDEFTPDRRLVARWRTGQGRARRMLASSDGALWVGTQDGVYRRATGAAAFVRVTLDDGAALAGNVNALVEGLGGVWVGGNSGLYRAAVGRPTLQRVTSPPEHGLLKPQVLGVHVGRGDVLWVDTSAGLHRMTQWDGQQAHFQVVAAVGEPARGSVGANLLEDARGRIWTHLFVYDPADGTGRELGSADGVDIGTGWFRSYTALADGRLLFGGSAGLLVVEPDAFQPWNYLPPVVVSELRVGGERQPMAASGSAQGVTLSPTRSSFSVEFAALDFRQPGLNRYRYRLQGFDAGWTETGADFRVASYGNLPPGDYVLQVQGSNRQGLWSPQEITLPVRVLPAWWQTWWTRALALLALLTLLLGVVQLRTGMLRRQQAVLERRVRERTAALEVLSRQLQDKSRALEASSLTDPLTGLNNRRYLSQNIEADVAVVVRRHEQYLRSGGAPPEDADLVFFLIDIDHFKQVNDQYGHAGGDAVLVQMRERLQQAFRQGDHLVRWGGEEFLIVARGISRQRAAELAERARAVVAGTPFVLDDGTAITRSCSVGFAAFPLMPALPAALDWAVTVDVADAALYTVKRQGRNGWLGVLSAQADSAAALRAAAAAPLADWRASGALQTVESEGLTSESPATAQR